MFFPHIRHSNIFFLFFNSKSESPTLSSHYFFILRSERHISQWFHSWLYSSLLIPFYRFFFSSGVVVSSLLLLEFSFLLFLLLYLNYWPKREIYYKKSVSTLLRRDVQSVRQTISCKQPAKNMICFTRFKDFCVEHKSILNTRFSIC